MFLSFSLSFIFSLFSPAAIPIFFQLGIYPQPQQRRSFPLSSAIPLTSQIEKGRLYPTFFRKSYKGIFLLVLLKFPSSCPFYGFPYFTFPSYFLMTISFADLPFLLAIIPFSLPFVELKKRAMRWKLMGK